MSFASEEQWTPTHPQLAKMYGDRQDLHLQMPDCENAQNLTDTPFAHGCRAIRTKTFSDLCCVTMGWNHNFC